MNPNEAIRAWRTSLGLSQAKFGEMLGYEHPQSRIANYESTNPKTSRVPSLEDIQLMANAVGCESISHFLVGPELSKHLESYGGNADSKVALKRIVGAHLKAGNGEILYDFETAEDRSFDREWLRSRDLVPSNCLLWTTSGDSMYPTIEDGELVLVNLREREPMHAKVFALLTEDGLRLKRLMRRSDNTWEIRSDNEDKRLYPTEPMEPGQVAIMGRVRWHAGEM